MPNMWDVGREGGRAQPVVLDGRISARVQTRFAPWDEAPKGYNIA